MFRARPRGFGYISCLVRDILVKLPWGNAKSAKGGSGRRSLSEYYYRNAKEGQDFLWLVGGHRRFHYQRHCGHKFLRVFRLHSPFAENVRLVEGTNLTGRV